MLSLAFEEPLRAPMTVSALSSPSTTRPRIDLPPHYKPQLDAFFLAIRSTDPPSDLGRTIYRAALRRTALRTNAKCELVEGSRGSAKAGTGHLIDSCLLPRFGANLKVPEEAIHCSSSIERKPAYRCGAIRATEV